MIRVFLWAMVLSMVAVEVFAVGDSSKAPETTNGGASATAAMSKAFAICTKLSDNNYMIWYAGILTVLVGVTVEPFTRVLEVLETIKDQLHNSLGGIETGIATTLFKLGSAAELKASNAWKQVNTALFNVIYWTVDEQIPGLMHSLASTMMFKGLDALKYIHDNYGPGCGTAQVGRAMDIMSEKQDGTETAQEYGTRLLTINATLQERIPDSILKQILLRGIASPECRKFLLGEMSSKNLTFVQLVAKAREYEMQEATTNNVDGLNANARRGNNKLSTG